MKHPLLKLLILLIITLACIFTLAACDTVTSTDTYTHKLVIETDTQVNDTPIIYIINGVAKLPNFYLTRTNERTKITQEEQLTLDNLEFSNPEYSFLRDGNAYPIDINVFPYEETVKATLVWYNGIYLTEADDLNKISASFIIRRDPTPVERLTLKTHGETIQPSSSIAISIDVYPLAAAYWDTEFTIEYIIVDNIEITDQTAIANYTSISSLDGGLAQLRTTPDINPGDTIAIRGRTIADNVFSELLIITVIPKI